MAINVPIVLHNKTDHSKKQLVVELSDGDTVKSIGERLSSATGLPSCQFTVILCGRVLEDSTPIRELLLGPSTSLVALVVNQKPTPTVQSSSEVPVPSTPQIGSFYLWCKTCSDLTRGKLRVYCSCCSSSAVIVKNEPQGWNDVLVSRRIRVSCEDCNDSDAYAMFRFKCVSCSEIGAPLSQVRGNWEHSPCCICTEEGDSYMFDLGCNHPVCRDCFRQYVKTQLSEGLFVFRVPFGYTIGCPYAGCEYYVRDVHHFYVMGVEKYKQYQQLATEKLVALHDQGVFCPFPDCGSYFFWEPDGEDANTYCPNCYRQFCRNCNAKECSCGKDDPNKITIAATTRKCPGCKVDTEHNGGCLHMRCTSCSLNWCFRCVKEWSDECQWDHWFG